MVYKKGLAGAGAYESEWDNWTGWLRGSSGYIVCGSGVCVQDTSVIRERRRDRRAELEGGKVVLCARVQVYSTRASASSRRTVNYSISIYGTKEVAGDLSLDTRLPFTCATLKWSMLGQFRQIWVKLHSAESREDASPPNGVTNCHLDNQHW